MLSQTKGGAVHLADGPDRLVVTEGIETTLSLMLGLYPSAHSVWAALSTSGMVALDLPPTPRQLVIASHGDHAGYYAPRNGVRRRFMMVCDRASGLQCLQYTAQCG